MLRSETVKSAGFGAPETGSTGRSDHQPAASPIVARREVGREQRLAGTCGEPSRSQGDTATAAAHDQRFGRARIGEGVGALGPQRSQEAFGLATETTSFVRVLF
ncbi:hypothetical protein MPPM_0549 [Methylorubrum populi]|uniref:Uncharacterized protein n=1 Tax=Methylorubrum populi TaxID=223967 RepID=A0A160PAH9_9HYPH|nr:hypothetical protein MPPM_0549 [Methylorubrum populi]